MSTIAPETPSQPSRARRWLREPLLHFVVAGFVLFAIYGGLNASSKTEEPLRIEITPNDINQIGLTWLAQWQRPPTDSEMRGLLNDYVREEVLYREAISLGLEKGDTIVRRRLAQKMDFIAEDVTTLREPTSTELEAWYAKNSAQFASPSLASFHHLFFASDKRGASAEAQARKVLASLNSKDATGGDAFMFEDAYVEQTPEQVARVFGGKFAISLFKEQPGAWHGPLESGYGWHLVWIDTLKPSEPPPLESVLAQVKAAWLSEQRALAKQATFNALKARYEIVMPTAAAGTSVEKP